MAKTVELFRHTDNDGDALTPEGVVAAVELGAHLAGGYQLAVFTGAQRATQGLACLLAGLGQRVPGGVVVEPTLRSEHEERWREIYRETGRGDLESFRSAAPDFVEEEALRLGKALERVLDRLPDGGRALVVGHSPTNEAAVYGLTQSIVAPLGKGEGVRIIAPDGPAGDGYTVERLS